MPAIGSIKSMSVEKLAELKAQIDAALKAKVMEERQSLESRLDRLSRLGIGPSRGRPAGARGGARGPVAPKYRNPDNPSETWAGRGLKPRWLAAALKSGKKIEDFAIAGAAKTSAKKMPTKTRRGRKPAKK